MYTGPHPGNLKTLPIGAPNGLAALFIKFQICVTPAATHSDPIFDLQDDNMPEDEIGPQFDILRQKLKDIMDQHLSKYKGMKPYHQRMGINGFLRIVYTMQETITPAIIKNGWVCIGAYPPDFNVMMGNCTTHYTSMQIQDFKMDMVSTHRRLGYVPERMFDRRGIPYEGKPGCTPEDDKAMCHRRSVTLTNPTVFAVWREQIRKKQAKVVKATGKRKCRSKRMGDLISDDEDEEDVIFTERPLYKRQIKTNVTLLDI